MSHWIVYSLLFYVIYKIIKGFVFPAIQITNTVNGKMKEMQERMKEMEQEQHQQQTRQSRKKEGEYIDYEEIKQHNYQKWEEITDILFRELKALESYNVDAIMICNNTLHKALEMKKIHLKVPIIHIVENVGNLAKKR